MVFPQHYDNLGVPIFALFAESGEGMDAWIQWLNGTSKETIQPTLAFA